MRFPESPLKDSAVSGDLSSHTRSMVYRTDVRSRMKSRKICDDLRRSATVCAHLRSSTPVICMPDGWWRAFSARSGCGRFQTESDGEATVSPLNEGCLYDEGI